MVTKSSAYRGASSAGPSRPSIALMRWIGFTRPPCPICGPSAPKASPRLKTSPRRTHAAARRTTSGVMKLRVPRSSSAPHRPQFETRRASSRTRSISISPPTPGGSLSMRQLRLCGRRGGHLVAVVDAPEVAAGVRLAVPLDPVPHLPRHLGLPPGHVAHVVELVVARLEVREDPVVADPVGHALDEPGAALGPEVVGAGEPEQALRERVVPVHALGRLGHALLVRDHERGV